MKYLISRVGFAALIIAVLLTSFGGGQSGLTLVAVAQETDDPVKIEVYTRFVNNRKTNEAAAYQAAKEYMQKYPKDNDQYTQYLQKWIVIYERDERKRRLPVMPRWTSSVSAPRRKSRYLLRRSTVSMVRPATSAGSVRGTGQRRRRSYTCSAFTRRPSTCGSTPRRVVSTSGSSGIARQAFRVDP